MPGRELVGMPAFVVVDLVDRQTDRQTVCLCRLSVSCFRGVRAFSELKKSREFGNAHPRRPALGAVERCGRGCGGGRMVGLQAREPEEERQPAAAEIHLVWRLHHGRSSRSAFP